MPNFQDPLDQTFHALADPTRRAIIARLVQGAASVSELAEPFDMALPSLMQHIKVLEQGGLLKSHKTGRVRTCRLDAARLGQAQDWLAEQRALWEGRLDRLDAYLKDMTAKEIPDDPQP
ncbi:ArsR family transcriptional regulator [Maricaulis sp. W15]|uniref:ArsR/SmtB family transcription factor n=1 Tax=Maricaulis sp. W15 TaxID=1772333 RepID=UPI000948D638|nr:metalloregulator ArsR/SmtB family transcription factor [Maricaulis sp. W15]OLF77828.1 ArsR family transcriptional regulator [Maricaulis sp. W15]